MKSVARKRGRRRIIAIGRGAIFASESKKKHRAKRAPSSRPSKRFGVKNGDDLVAPSPKCSTPKPNRAVRKSYEAVFGGMNKSSFISSLSSLSAPLYGKEFLDIVP